MVQLSRNVLQQLFVAECLHSYNKNLTSSLAKDPAVAKALLDNPAQFTIFMLSTHSRRVPMPTLPTSANTCCHQALVTLLCQLCCIGLMLPSALGAPLPKDHSSDPSKFTVRVEAPESDVATAVEQVTQDQIIHGTYSYEKERILYGAHSAQSANAFGTWKGSGKVFYKVANDVLAPRFFKDTGDIGTLSVRYVVQSADTSAAILQIDAVFIDARNIRHESIGTVESNEFLAIQQHLRTIQSKRQEAEEKASNGTSYVAAPAATPSSVTATTVGSPSPTLDLTVPAMQKHVAALQHEVELRVKGDGAQLKSAPFHSAATLESLPAESDVLIVVLTPYWYGVETEDGHRGWVHHSQLEPLP
jgi:hypothetical protein